MESEEYKVIEDLLPKVSPNELTKLYVQIRSLVSGIEAEAMTFEATSYAEKRSSAIKDALGIDICSRQRDARVTLFRMCFIEEMLQRRYSFSSIAKSLGRNHSTVLYFSRKLDAIKAYPKMYQDYYAVKKQYKEITRENDNSPLQD